MIQREGGNSIFSWKRAVTWSVFRGTYCYSPDHGRDVSRRNRLINDMINAKLALSQKNSIRTMTVQSSAC